MQTNYLRYFIDVASYGSMSAAAKKNFMSPQGISRSIAALESELGCELFVRDSNKVTLTRFGEQLLEDARELIAHENNIRRSVLELHGDELKKSRLHFTLYCSPLFFDTPLFFPMAGVNIALYGKVQFLQRNTPHVVDLLVDAARDMHPEVVVAGGLALFDLFADENVKMAKRLAGASYEYRPFMRMQDYVLVPEYSMLAKAESLTKAQIGMHHLAVAASGGMERAITRHIGAESIYVSAGDSAFRNRLCRMGEVLTFVPGASLVFGVPEGTVAVPMEDPYTIEIGFAARPAAFDVGVLADVLEKLTSFYRQYEDQGVFELVDGCASA